LIILHDGWPRPVIESHGGLTVPAQKP
jgi:hypothetical protein